MATTQRLGHLRRATALAAGTGLFLLIAAADALAPPELSVVPLFLVPILLVAWNAGWAWAGGLASAAGVVGLLNDLVFGHPYSSLSYLGLTSLIRTCAYLLVAFGVSSLMRRIYDQEHRLSRSDFLTGLPNRLAFYDAAAREMERQRRYRRPLALVYLDLDHFKEVNDRLGHRAGDSLLREVAGVMRSCLRQADFAARLGGDEFAVLLPETGGESVRTVVGNLRERLREAMRRGGWPVTFSFGVAAFDEPAADVETMIELADRAMYRAKQAGKDRIEMASRTSAPPPAPAAG